MTLRLRKFHIKEIKMFGRKEQMFCSKNLNFFSQETRKINKFQENRNEK